MGKKNLRRTIIILSIALVLVVLVAVTGSAAWFSTEVIVTVETEILGGKEGNGQVKTTLATGSTGTNGLNLYISDKSGDEFTEETTAPITQVNSADMTSIMPVSTADLKTFYTCTHTEAGQTATFSKLENEELIYHGRIYLKAAAEGIDEGRKLKLCLDKSEGLPLISDSQELLNAARLAFVMDGQTYIFYLSDQHNQSAQVQNTYIEGVGLVPEGNVLTQEAGQLSYTEDPAQDINKCCIDISAANVTQPELCLAEMNLNEIYQLDVYFYLEGCDPDCSNYIMRDDAELGLSFFGLLD